MIEIVTLAALVAALRAFYLWDRRAVLQIRYLEQRVHEDNDDE